MLRSTRRRYRTTVAALAVAGLLLAVAFPAAATAAPAPPIIQQQACGGVALVLGTFPDRWLIDYCFSGTVTPANRIVASSDGNTTTLFGQYSPPPSSAVRIPLDRTGCDEVTNHFF